MNSLPVWQQHDSQIPAIHLCNLRPAPNSTIGLNYFLHGIVYHSLDPVGFDEGAVRAVTHLPEVLSGLHTMTLAETGIRLRAGTTVLRAVSDGDA